MEYATQLISGKAVFELPEHNAQFAFETGGGKILRRIESNGVPT